MFRNVYGLKEQRWKAADGIVEFIQQNKIVAIHELESAIPELAGKLSHRENPTLYFFLPDGTQPVEPAYLRIEGSEILEKLRQLMDAYGKWNENRD